MERKVVVVPAGSQSTTVPAGADTVGDGMVPDVKDDPEATGEHPNRAAGVPAPAPDDAPRICVYCASRGDTIPTYARIAAEVGRLIVASGASLVFGGGHVGLMGIVADTVLEAGGRVTGVIPQHLVDMEEAHTGLTELVVVDDMPQRKRTMFQRSDAFLTLPGGIGTMEEMFEVLTWQYLGLHRKPVGLLNVDGYYDHLIAFLDGGLERGLISARARASLLVGTEPVDLVDQLVTAIASTDPHA